MRSGQSQGHILRAYETREVPEGESPYERPGVRFRVELTDRNGTELSHRISPPIPKERLHAELIREDLEPLYSKRPAEVYRLDRFGYVNERGQEPSEAQRESGRDESVHFAAEEHDRKSGAVRILNDYGSHRPSPEEFHQAAAFRFKAEQYRDRRKLPDREIRLVRYSVPEEEAFRLVPDHGFWFTSRVTGESRPAQGTVLDTQPSRDRSKGQNRKKGPDRRTGSSRLRRTRKIRKEAPAWHRRFR